VQNPFKMANVGYVFPAMSNYPPVLTNVR